jgi:transcriptional regulator with XRE-family HTH domain
VRPFAPHLHLVAALAGVGWSQAELADRVGVSSRTIRRWVRGDAPVPPAVLRWLSSIDIAIHAVGPAPKWNEPDSGE